ncbi:MAG: LCP family protein [Clostridia bacterium]|nr:LCP family protein [Clostridia bacterium]
MKHRRVKKKTKFSLKKRLAVFGISLTVLVIAFVAVMSFGGLFLTYDDTEDTENIAEVDKETGKINILVIGLDNDGTRTDTIMVATYDLDNDAVNILSIPRDTRMYVGGRYQKINCAYAIRKDGKMKGVDGTIEAVSRLTAIPINYYVEFTFETFREMIDALGGVDYDVPQNMNYDDPAQNLHIHLTKGYQHLDGDKAEQLVRFRKYPQGDIDRVKVQQSFIKELAKQKLNASVIAKMPDIFKVLQKNVKTNFKPSDVTKYAVNVMDLSSDNIHAYSLPGTADSESYGASFWIPDMEETKKLVEETFGYDATKATIHSADGKSISKDVKVVKPTEEPVKEEEKTAVETKPQQTKNTATEKKETTQKATDNTKKEATAEKETTKETTKDTTEKGETETAEKPNNSSEIVRPSANPTKE